MDWEGRGYRIHPGSRRSERSYILTQSPLKESTPEVIPSGGLGSKHQLTDLKERTFDSSRYCAQGVFILASPVSHFDAIVRDVESLYSGWVQNRTKYP